LAQTAHKLPVPERIARSDYFYAAETEDDAKLVAQEIDQTEKRMPQRGLALVRQRFYF
jgi:hypothetical protein